jgi:hypothetical protein
VTESYGIVWQENGAAPVAGKLEIGPSELHLEGSDRDHLVARSFAIADLVGMHVGRGSGDRLDGHPTLLLELAGGETVRIAALAQAGIVAEIAERLEIALTVAGL